MKHTPKIVALLLCMFLLTHIIGLFVVANYQKYFATPVTFFPVFENKTLKQITQPSQISQKQNLTLISQLVPEKVEIKQTIDALVLLTNLIMAIVIATIIFLFFTRIKSLKAIKLWFAFVIFIALTISFSLLLYPLLSRFSFAFTNLAELLGVLLALFFTYLKVFKRDIIAHNLSELFVYAGIAVIFLPLLNLQIIIALLLLISLYDVIAVFKTGHMVEMAKFQIQKLGIIAGLLIPYLSKKQLQLLKSKYLARIKKKAKQKKLKVAVAILGGGDLAFSLMFASVVLVYFGWLYALIVTLCSTLALLLLMLFSDDKPYPAMPPITVGCLSGLMLALLLI